MNFAIVHFFRLAQTKRSRPLLADGQNVLQQWAFDLLRSFIITPGKPPLSSRVLLPPQSDKYSLLI